MEKQEFETARNLMYVTEAALVRGSDSNKNYVFIQYDCMHKSQKSNDHMAASKWPAKRLFYRYLARRCWESKTVIIKRSDFRNIAAVYLIAFSLKKAAALRVK